MRAHRHIDISGRPDLLQVVQEVQANNEPLVLRREGKDMAILRPVKAPKRSRNARALPFTQNDPIWNLCGIGRSGVHDVSENVDKYLAEALLNSHRPDE